MKFCFSWSVDGAAGPGPPLARHSSDMRMPYDSCLMWVYIQIITLDTCIFFKEISETKYLHDNFDEK